MSQTEVQLIKDAVIVNADVSGSAAIDASKISGTVTAATTATNVTVADESSDTTCFPLFATAATGNLPPKSGSNLTFNSSTGALSAGSFVKSLILFMGSFRILLDNSERFSNPIQLSINNTVVHNCYPVLYDEAGRDSQDYAIYTFNTVEVISPGDKLQLFAPGSKIITQGSTFAGIKINGV